MHISPCFSHCNFSCCVVFFFIFRVWTRCALKKSKWNDRIQRGKKYRALSLSRCMKKLCKTFPSRIHRMMVKNEDKMNSMLKNCSIYSENEMFHVGVCVCTSINYNVDNVSLCFEMANIRLKIWFGLCGGGCVYVEEKFCLHCMSYIAKR